MLKDLETKIQSYIAESDSEMGVAVHHIESDQQIMINADRLYPLASVIKVPILVEAFHQIAESKLRLDDRWTVTKDLGTVGSGLLPVFDNGLTPTVRDLLTLMIIISDNTATDMMFDRLGVQNVNSRMKKLGLSDIHVPHNLKELFIDMVPGLESATDHDFLSKYTSKHGVRRDGWAYREDETNNCASPRHMARLFEMIYKGEMLDRAACDAMLDILLKQTLNERLPRFLPHGTKVAHKTGTISGVRDDSGIIYAGENSHVIVSIFALWDSTPTLQDRFLSYERQIQIDSAMGKIALAAYEAFYKD